MTVGSFVLISIFIVPIIGLIILSFIPSERVSFIKFFGLSVALLDFILSLFLWVLFDNSAFKFQFTSYFD
jgi:NADH:ubiquinone oxidoreductase subunit 4 (subunit M)